MKASKIASVVLAVALTAAVASVCFIPAAAAPSSPKYVALGDSIAAGYALENYTRDGSTPQGSYVSLVCDGISASSLADLAVSGDDTSDLLAHLETASYRNAIAAADVITLSMGSNDLLGPGMKMLCEGFGVSNENELVAALSGADAVTAMTKFAQAIVYIQQPEQAARFNSAVEGFKTNWVKISDAIYALNPDATIIVNNFYNPYVGMGVGDASVGKTVQVYLDLMNEYITGHAYNTVRYHIADVTDVAYGKTNVVISFSCTSLDPHPNANGHEYIATKVLAVIGELAEAAVTTLPVTEVTASPGETTVPVVSSETLPTETTEGQTAPSGETVPVGSSETSPAEITEGQPTASQNETTVAPVSNGGADDTDSTGLDDDFGGCGGFGIVAALIAVCGGSAVFAAIKKK